MVAADVQGFAGEVLAGERFELGRNEQPVHAIEPDIAACGEAASDAS